MSIINYSTIVKRSNALSAAEACNESKEYAREYLINLENCIREDYNNGKKLSHKTVRAAELLLCGINSNISEATSYGADILSKIDAICDLDENAGKKFQKDYCSFVLPYSASLDSIAEVVRVRDNLDIVRENVKKYQAADRILKNHGKISERFNFELLNENINKNNLEYVCDEVASMIDSYNMSISGKLNSCIEELCYLFDKNGLDYDKKNIVKRVTEFYIGTAEELTEQDMEFMKRALKEGYYIDPEDSVSVDYLFGNEVPDQTTISGAIKAMMLGQVQLDPETFHTLGKNFTRTDVDNNISEMLSMITTMESYNKISSERVSELVNSLFVGIIEGDEEKADPLGRRAYFERCFESLKDFKKTVAIKETSDNTYTFNEGEQHITQEFGEAYDDYNIETIRFLKESGALIPVQEFGKFNLTNLVKAAINMSNYMKVHKTIRNTKFKLKRKNFVAKAKNVLFGEATTDMYKYLGEDGKFDICVEQIIFDEDYYSSGNHYFVSEYAEEMCKMFNERAKVEYPTIRAYYTSTYGVVEIHVKDSTGVVLTEDEAIEASKYISPELESYIEMLWEAGTVLESLEGKEIPSIDEIIENSIKLYPDEYSEEAFMLASEALIYSGANYEDIKAFCESCGNEYNDYIEAFDTYMRNYVPVEICVEAYDLFVQICEEAPVVKKPKVGGAAVKDNKPADTTKAKDEKESKPKATVNWDAKLNSLKLAMEGMKSKFANMSQKEKEVSKNLDNTATRFVKAMKDAMISDRREAIIKGSVIPSFSKCIKIGIALAGIGGISLATVGTVLPAVIIALGGFAMSKNLTRKERLLLLDDIETELDVIEKEIANAESKNQMKKYRKLLKIRKDLQRQYQRIKYNVRVGKDILPGSTAGIKNYNN